MPCTGPCFIKYTLIVGKILMFIWNNPLKDIVKDLVDESKAAHPARPAYKAKVGSASSSKHIPPFLTL